MRTTSSAICGTDLHIYKGRMGEVDGMVIGHEPPGIVEEVGPAVVSIKKGVSIGMGRDHDERYNTQLSGMIIAGRARPCQIVSHRLPLSQAPVALNAVDRKCSPIAFLRIHHPLQKMTITHIPDR